MKILHLSELVEEYHQLIYSKTLMLKIVEESGEVVQAIAKKEQDRSLENDQHMLQEIIQLYMVLTWFLMSRAPEAVARVMGQEIDRLIRRFGFLRKHNLEREETYEFRFAPSWNLKIRRDK